MHAKQPVGWFCTNTLIAPTPCSKAQWTQAHTNTTNAISSTQMECQCSLLLVLCTLLAIHTLRYHDNCTVFGSETKARHSELPRCAATNISICHPTITHPPHTSTLAVQTAPKLQRTMVHAEMPGPLHTAQHTQNTPRIHCLSSSSWLKINTTATTPPTQRTPTPCCMLLIDRRYSMRVL